MNTINFLYFVYNFRRSQLINALGNTSLKEHFLSKFDTIALRKGDGTQALLELLMQMSDDNKQIVIEWVENNYNYR